MSEVSRSDAAGDGPVARDRAELGRRLGELMRNLTLESDRLAHRFADHHSLHATDFRALTLIYDAERRGTPLTPGRLGAYLSLSSGAVTYLVERLVASGHVYRADDPHDRRRRTLRYSEHGHAVASAYFGPLGAGMAAGLVEVSDADLEAACRVLETMTDVVRGYEGDLPEAAG